MKKKLVIFDLDGTVLNTLGDLTLSVNYAMRSKGFPERTIEEVRLFVGNGIRKLIERAVPYNCPEKDIDECHKIFTRYYLNNLCVETKPYNGIPELIKRLREDGFKTAVLSNKTEENVCLLCDKLLPGLFDITAGESPGRKNKPSPDGVYHILKELDINKNDAVFIGDSDTDVMTARNAGVDLICVSWGYRDKDQIKALGVETVADDTCELFDEIMKI